MGTSTSTRWGGYERKRHTTDFLAIPLWQKAMDNPVRLGESRETRWTDVAANGDYYMVLVKFKAVSEDRTDARINALHVPSGNCEDFTVELHRAPLRNGGYDWKVACPCSDPTSHAVKVLYLDHGLQKLISRTCGGLAYPSHMHDKALDGIKSKDDAKREAALNRVQKTCLKLIQDAVRVEKMLERQE